VGYTPYPTEVTEAFVQEAAATGVDIFRIFDALNDVDQMRPAIDAVLATDTTVAEVALCYTGDLLDPAEDLYRFDYYLHLADQGGGGSLSRVGGRVVRLGLARAVRPDRAGPHPRHRGRPARDPARGEPRRSGCCRRGECAHGRHPESAQPLGVRR